MQKLPSVGKFHWRHPSLIVAFTRVNARGATRAWIDRTNDGLSGCPPTASACRQKGTSARPAGAARRLGYINHIAGRKGYDRSNLSPHSEPQRILISSVTNRDFMSTRPVGRRARGWRAAARAATASPPCYHVNPD